MAANLLKRDFSAERLHQRRLGDTTELRPLRGKLYLFKRQIEPPGSACSLAAHAPLAS